MWASFTQQLTRVASRAGRISASRSLHSVAVQLNHSMPPQLAGIASAVVQDLYQSHGLDVTFLSPCLVGSELERVRQHQDANPGSVVLGSVDQHVFIPTLYNSPRLELAAVAAMFRQSPLCIVSTNDHALGGTIGANENDRHTFQLIQRIFPNHQLVASPPQQDAVAELKAGTLHGIQADWTTQVPVLRRELGYPVVVPLDGANRARLGYGQVLFANKEDEESESNDRHHVMVAFSEATFEGWEHVISNPQDGVKVVHQAQQVLGLDDDDQQNSHSAWQEASEELQVEMMEQCNDLVWATNEGGAHLGVIDPLRWSAATQWLLDGKPVDVEDHEYFGLDYTVWK